MIQPHGWFTFSIKDILWATALVAVMLCWYRNHTKAEHLLSESRAAQSELATTKQLASVLSDMYRVTNYQPAPGTAIGNLPLSLSYPNKRVDSYDVVRLLLSKSNCVILGEVVEAAQGLSGHEAMSHFSGIFKVRIIDVAKGKGLPTGDEIDIHIDSIRELIPTKGDKKVFLAELGDDLHSLSTDDIRFCVQPEFLFSEFKSQAEEMRNHPR